MSSTYLRLRQSPAFPLQAHQCQSPRSWWEEGCCLLPASANGSKNQSDGQACLERGLCVHCILSHPPDGMDVSCTLSGLQQGVASVAGRLSSEVCWRIFPDVCLQYASKMPCAIVWMSSGQPLSNGKLLNALVAAHQGRGQELGVHMYFVA